MTKAKTHCVIRTSPKGEGIPFVGECALCGATGLKASDALKECPNPDNVSEDDMVIIAIGGKGGKGRNGIGGNGGTAIVCGKGIAIGGKGGDAS